MRKTLLILSSLLSVFYAVAQGGDAVVSTLNQKSRIKCLHRVELAPRVQLVDYDIFHYDFDLNIERDVRDISGKVSILAKALKSDFTTFEYELFDTYTVDSVIINGQKAILFNPEKHARRAVVMNPIAQNQLFMAHVYYRGKAPLSTNNWGNGIVQKKDAKYNFEAIYSLSVPYHAKEWFPVKQVLSDLVDSVTMRITTNIENEVISNGLLINDISKPNNKHTVIWKTHYPTNFYLISFALGKYITYKQEVTLTGKNKPMPVWHYLYNQASLNKQKSILDQTGAMLNNYGQYYGLYPFHEEKFGTVIVPLSGGMEHQTVVNLATDYDKFLLAHEMSHQWWGDNVNAKSYHDVWLNEGWATYSEYLTAEKLYPTEARSILDNFHNSAVSATEGRVYVADTTDFTTIYNFTNVYMKGAAIIHTLRNEIGNDSLFFAALRKYQQVYSHKSVDVPELKRFLEQETSKDLSLFFNQWYYGYGFPRFTVTWTNRNKSLILKSVQTTSSPKTPLFKTPVEILVKRLNKIDTIVTIYQSKNEQTYAIMGLTDVTNIAIDPRNVLINKVISIKQDPDLVQARNVIPPSMVTIYPTPANDVINVKTELEGSWILELYRPNGQMLYQSLYNVPTESLNISNLTSGTYVVKIMDNQRRIWSKSFVVVH